MRMMKIASKVAQLIAVGIGVLLCVLWLDHSRETTLPTLTGLFAVGRTTCVWSDTGEGAPLAPQLNGGRELLAWIWYPAAPQQPSQSVVDYLPAQWRTAVERQRGPIITHLITRNLSRVRAHSLRDASVSPQQSSYPVILMRAGLAALTTDYTSLAEDLASHGYVVVAFDAPYRSSVVVLPDGRVITRAPQYNADLISGPQREQLASKLAEAWSADTSFALDQLQRLNASDPSGRFLNRLDMQRVGVFGHSLGGATALLFCHDDARCKAGIDLDGEPFGSAVGEGVTQPFMFLLSDHGGESGADSLRIDANIRSIYDHLPSSGRLRITIRGASHFRFSDDGALLKIPLVLSAMHKLGIVRLDGRRQLEVTTHCVSAFFDEYLKGAPVSNFNSQPEYPEIECFQCNRQMDGNQK